MQEGVRNVNVAKNGIRTARDGNFYYGLLVKEVSEESGTSEMQLDRKKSVVEVQCTIFSLCPTGIRLNVSIITVGVVCTFYSSLGGMKAVLITDVFQSLLMFTAIFAVITRGVMDFSLGEIFRIAHEGDRLEFFKYVFFENSLNFIKLWGSGSQPLSVCRLYVTLKSVLPHIIKFKTIQFVCQKYYIDKEN